MRHTEKAAARQPKTVKEYHILMRKLISLALCAGLAAGLSACSAEEGAEPETSLALQDDSSYVLTPAESAEPLPDAGAVIALAVNDDGVETGVNAMLWQGVQAFCENFGYTAQLYEAEGDDAQANQDSLRRAAESGAELVVCAGADMEVPLFELQNNYPTVNYLMLDGEPHSDDYASYTTASNVHCVLFSEEQAGYLAGYAAVADGYTSLGFLGADMQPGIVRYGTGFLQGAQAAAEQNGMEVTLKIWYSGLYDASDEITARMGGWYTEGTQVIFAVGGTLAQSCIDAVQDSSGRVIAADWDQSALGGQVLGSAVKRFSTVVQNQLYGFYADGAGWNEDQSGQTERVGVSAGGVGLASAQWGFLEFAPEEYDDVYNRLVSGALRVERYSDPDPEGLIQAPNVTVDYQN